MFVGRASFQMVPAGTLRNALAEAGAERDEARQEVVAALRAEARALRLESEARVAAATAALAAAPPVPVGAMRPFEPTVVVSDSATAAAEPTPHATDRRGVVLQLLPPVEVTEQIDARATADRRARRGGGVSPRTIVVALLAGASLTLTAQAVVRRPGAEVAPKHAAKASGATPAVAAAEPAPQPVPVVPVVDEAPVPALPQPTVVASTLSVPATDADVAATTTARKRVQAARVAAPSRPKAAAVRPTHQTAGTTWVDPFVTAPGEPGAQDHATADSPRTKSPKKARSGKRSVAAADWVDPFVE